MSTSRSEASSGNVIIHYRRSSILPRQGSSPKSLLEYLDLLQLNCLNEVDDHNLKGILSGKTKNTTDSYLLSDADEQLLLNIYVRLSSPRAYETV